MLLPIDVQSDGGSCFSMSVMFLDTFDNEMKSITGNDNSIMHDLTIFNVLYGSLGT